MYERHRFPHCARTGLGAARRRCPIAPCPRSNSRADLESALAAGRRIKVQVVGLARIADDVTPELARDAIESVTVLGAFQASSAVRRALSDSIH